MYLGFGLEIGRVRGKFRRRIGRIRRTGSEGEKDREREGENLEEGNKKYFKCIHSCPWIKLDQSYILIQIAMIWRQ